MRQAEREHAVCFLLGSPRPGKTDQKHQKDSDSMVEVKDWTGHGKRGLGQWLTFNYSQG